MRDKLIHHLRVGQSRQLGQAQHVRQTHGGKSLRLDRLQVPAAALHVEDRLFLAEEVFFADLDRGVAASVQHQRFVAAEQPRGVDAQAEVALEFLRFVIAPETLHRLPICQLY